MVPAPVFPVSAPFLLLLSYTAFIWWYYLSLRHSSVSVMTDEIIATASTFESQAKVNESKIFLGHKTSAVFHRDLHYEPFKIASASGIHFHFTNGQKVVDATGGAAVSCIGHGDPRVRDAISAQFDALDYCHSMFFSCPSSEELCQALIDTTNGQMAKAYIVCSGVSSPTARKFAPRTNQCC